MNGWWARTVGGRSRARRLAIGAISSAALLISGLVAVPAVTATDEPADDSVFTIASVPDTQLEVLADDNPLMAGRYRWLAENKDALNLKFVTHVGDVVNWGVQDPAQFTRASRATDILDQNAIPYAYALGNHDTGAVQVGGTAAPGTTRLNLRNTTAFNNTFPLSRIKNVAGTFEPGKVDNIYQTFQAGGANWLVITHEMWPRQAVINWMKQVVAAHPNDNVIVNTHAYIDGAGQLPTTGFYGDTTAQSEWDQFLSQYPNIRIVLSGHYAPRQGGIGAYYAERRGVHGNKVQQVMTAYTHADLNHVRLLRVDTKNQTLSSSVYTSVSTKPGLPTGYVTDAYSNFQARDVEWVGTGAVTPPSLSVPSAPLGVTATAGAPGSGTVSVAFTPPLNDGGAAVTGYRVTSSPGGRTATGSGSPLTVSGLTAGTSYTFTVTATNSVGEGLASTPSAAVNPSVVSPELLPDQGFESGAGGWVPFVVGTFNRVQTPAPRSGSHSMQVSTPANPSSGLTGMTQNSVIANSVAGTRYTIRCYAQPSVSGRTLRVRLLQYPQDWSSNIKIGELEKTNVAAGNWTLMQVSGVATVSGRRIIPQIYSTNQSPTSGTVRYDDCSVTTG